MKLAVQGAFWIFVYLAVASAPLVFAWVVPEPGRGLLINLSATLAHLGIPAEKVYIKRFGMV